MKMTYKMSCRALIWILLVEWIKECLSCCNSGVGVLKRQAELISIENGSKGSGQWLHFALCS